MQNIKNRNESPLSLLLVQGQQKKCYNLYSNDTEFMKTVQYWFDMLRRLKEVFQN